jgi:type II secretory pathway component PulF
MGGFRGVLGPLPLLVSLLLDLLQSLHGLLPFLLLLLLQVVHFLLEVLQPLLVVVEDWQHALLSLPLVELLHGDEAELFAREDPPAELSELSL